VRLIDNPHQIAGDFPPPVEVAKNVARKSAGRARGTERRVKQQVRRLDLRQSRSKVKSAKIRASMRDLQRAREDSNL
jgi:hypothetical protein